MFRRLSASPSALVRLLDGGVLPPGGSADAEPVEPVTSDGTGPHANGGSPRRRTKTAPAAPARATPAHAVPKRKAR